MAKLDYINDRWAHRPPGPKSGDEYLVTPRSDDSSRLFQPDIYDVELENLFVRYAETQPGFDIGIDLYQQWCELNWKQPHGTVWSNERFVGKLLEELKESVTEIESGDKSKTEDELGDLLWCATANASNLGRNVKHALMLRLTEYGHGKRYSDGRVPPYIRMAQHMVFDTENFTAAGINQLIDCDFLPEASATSYADEIDQVTRLEIDDVTATLFNSVFLLKGWAERNYENDWYHNGAVEGAEAIDTSIADIYLSIAFLAKHCADSTLAEIMRKNIIKLSRRVETNTVDKSDGHRQ